MIRGKYLRERKALRVKRRIKLLIAAITLVLLYHVLFSSYSIYESEANSTAAIDVAFFVLDDEYETQVITLEDMNPGDEQYCNFSIANYMIDENGEKFVSETDMEYELKIRTTTNLPLSYELYKNQSIDVTGLQNILETETVFNYSDEDSTIFKRLVQSTLSAEEKEEGITDKGTFLYSANEGNGISNTYILKVSLPESCNSADYQNIIECIEITVDARQILQDEVGNP